jgi:hypothetical protein
LTGPKGARYVAVRGRVLHPGKRPYGQNGGYSRIVEKKGFIKKSKTRKPAPLNIDLVLGPQQITTISTSTPEGK